jgi:hypothetical protein
LIERARRWQFERQSAKLFDKLKTASAVTGDAVKPAARPRQILIFQI